MLICYFCDIYVDPNPPHICFTSTYIYCLYAYFIIVHVSFFLICGQYVLSVNLLLFAGIVCYIDFYLISYINDNKTTRLRPSYRIFKSTSLSP